MSEKQGQGLEGKEEEIEQGKKKYKPIYWYHV